MHNTSLIKFSGTLSGKVGPRDQVLRRMRIPREPTRQHGSIAAPAHSATPVSCGGSALVETVARPHPRPTRPAEFGSQYANTRGRDWRPGRRGHCRRADRRTPSGRAAPRPRAPDRRGRSTTPPRRPMPRGRVVCPLPGGGSRLRRTQNQRPRRQMPPRTSSRMASTETAPADCSLRVVLAPDSQGAHAGTVRRNLRFVDAPASPPQRREPGDRRDPL
jgi:hypothetical protein